MRLPMHDRAQAGQLKIDRLLAETTVSTIAVAIMDRIFLLALEPLFINASRLAAGYPALPFSLRSRLDYALSFPSNWSVLLIIALLTTVTYECVALASSTFVARGILLCLVITIVGASIVIESGPIESAGRFWPAGYLVGTGGIVTRSLLLLAAGYGGSVLGRSLGTRWLS